ncbi:hypothetical protein Droror1_Dr00006137 [Drosera rotundifolia]
MDAVFQLGDPELGSFLFNLMNSYGFCYNCLWSYLSLHNWLTIKDAYYCDEANASAIVLYLAQRLFEDYGQQSIPIAEVDLVPGIAFRQQSPHLELRGAEIQILACCEPQRLFYQTEILSSASHKPPDVTHSADCVIQENNEVWIGVGRADGLKCERCLHYTPKVVSYPEHPTLCSRCYDVVAVKTQPAVAAVS